MRSSEILNQLHATIIEAQTAIADEMIEKLEFEPTRQDKLEYLWSVLRRNTSTLSGGPLEVNNIEQALRREVAITLLGGLLLR